jgi:hypothetical protein
MTVTCRQVARTINPKMNSQFLSEWLSNLSLAERTRALDSILFDLTICVRDLLLPSVSSEEKSSIIEKLIGFNELCHQLSAQIGHYLDGEETKVYPVDVFSQILFDKASHYRIISSLTSSITHTKTGQWSDPKDFTPPTNTTQSGTPTTH